ncbi:KAP family P-loop NTPase fold protein [Alteromonas sp. P256]|uniref:KAP family P-loop NTPase fold protein n=1 Tax=Alteromonas sp. P256 TaxID=3117399 RepID=UPI002FE412BC
MASSDNGKKWSIDGLKERLQNLCEKDNLWPSVLGARLALRAFPLIGDEGHFKFWIEVESKQAESKQRAKRLINDEEKKDSSPQYQDDRARFLLTSFFASHFNLQAVSLPIKKQQVENLAARAARTSKEAAEAASGYYRPAYVSNIAYASGDARAVLRVIPNPTRAASKVLDATFKDVFEVFSFKMVINSGENTIDEKVAGYSVPTDDTRTEDIFIFTSIISELMADLDAAESSVSIQSVSKSPLWSMGVPGALEAIKENKFRPAVEALIREISHSSPETAKALVQMLFLYEEVETGSVTMVRDNTFVKTVYQAVSKLTAEDVNANRDTLNRGALIKGLASILCNEEHIHPLTIGLMGHWGSGKTQLLELLKKELKSRDSQQPFLFGEFNAWTYEHAKSSQAAMVHEVILALTSCDKLEPVGDAHTFNARFTKSTLTLLRQMFWKITGRARLVFGFAVKKHLTKVLQSIGWFVLFVIASLWLASNGLSQNQLPDFSKPLTSGALIAILVSMWQLPKQLRDLISQPMTKEFLTYIKLPNYASHIGEITEMQKDIRLMAKLRLGFVEESCQEHVRKVTNPRRLLFVVDDLDRCSPKGIVRTFEAIRLVLNIPHVTVIVAVDQRIALAALALHYKDIELYHTLQDARAIARDYLAKMIQLPIVLSDGDDDSLTDFLSDIWLEKGNDKRSWLTHLSESEEQKEQEVSPPVSTAGETGRAPTTPKEEKQDVDSSIDSKGMTEGEVATFILEGESKLTSYKSQIFPGLCDSQKAALYYWATHFGLRNARQLKRLDNSYNLLRLVTDKEDKTVLTQTVDGIDRQHVKFSYGYLVALMTLEFINSIEMTTLRENASRFLRQGEVGKLEGMANQQHKSTLIAARVVIQHAAEKLYPRTRDKLHFDKLLSYVESFVLPAIDGFDIDTETASSS